MHVSRVEKHVVRRSSQWFQMLDHFCFLSKNLYNHANYLIRKQFTDDGTWLRYEQLDTILKTDAEYPDYQVMPMKASSQQTLRYLDAAWTSFFSAIKDWRKHPEKYRNCPKPPKYLNKQKGRYPIYLTYQNVSIKKDGLVHFPKTFKGFVLHSKAIDRPDFVKIQQCRILSRGNHVVVELVYLVNVPEVQEDNQRYIGIDLGVDNLAAIGNNVGLPFYLIDGKGLKSINKYYNKLLSHYKSVTKMMNNRFSSKRVQRIHQTRNNMVQDYLHKVSRWIVEFAKENQINTIVIGKNDLWKEKTQMSKSANQTFVQIPHAKLITMIQYKAEAYGINVVLREEAYTSGTSFLDGEQPVREHYNKSRRKYRGMFVTNTGLKINADANGSMQILRKYNASPKIIDINKLTAAMQSPTRIKVS